MAYKHTSETLRKAFFGDRWSAVFCGSRLTVKHRTDVKRPRPHGKRKPIRGFSRGSRLRMLKMAAEIEWRLLGDSIFITLTIPDECGVGTPDSRTAMRHGFVRYMESYLQEQIPILWRVEWKRRKSGVCTGKFAPHIHLLVLGVKYVPQEKIRAWWRKITGKEGPLSTDVRDVKGGEMAAVYIAKYCAKSDTVPSLDNVTYLNNAGRQWGVHRRGLVPRCRECNFDFLTREIVAWLRRVAGAKLHWYDPTIDEGFTLLGDVAKIVGEKLLQTALDSPMYTW